MIGIESIYRWVPLHTVMLTLAVEFPDIEVRWWEDVRPANPSHGQ